MEGMHGGNMHGMEGMAPQAMNGTGSMMNGMHGHNMLSHMTFFWGHNAEILFSGWPGTNRGMYILSLVLVFVLAILVEWLSHCKVIRDGLNHVAVGLVQTAIHTIRIGLAYLVMLALMSFNVGVFLVAVAGHALGFLLFGSSVLKKSLADYGMTSDSLPMSC